MTQRAIRTIRSVSSPQAFNVGINLGAVSGGSRPTTCTSTSCPAGAAMPTSSPSPAAPRPCRSCCVRRATCSRRRGRSTGNLTACSTASRPSGRARPWRRSSTCSSGFGSALTWSRWSAPGRQPGALWFFPQGMVWQGVLFITAFVFSDLIDGAMARKIGRTDDFGNFLDSTLDRIADGAMFAGAALYFAWVPRAALRRAVPGHPGDGRGHVVRPLGYRRPGYDAATASPSALTVFAGFLLRPGLLRRPARHPRPHVRRHLGPRDRRDRHRGPADLDRAHPGAGPRPRLTRGDDLTPAGLRSGRE